MAHSRTINRVSAGDAGFGRLKMGLGTRGASGPSISLTATSILESAVSGSTVGVLSVVGGTGVYTFTKTADPDAKFTVSGSNLNTAAALNYEAATSHSVTIEANNGAGSIVTRAITISVTNVFEASNLSALSLDAVTATVGVSATINIVGATSGSTITGTVPDGMTLNSGARTITGAPTTASVYNFTLTETLADSSNSPRSTSVTITVNEAGGFSYTFDSTSTTFDSSTITFDGA